MPITDNTRMKSMEADIKKLFQLLEQSREEQRTERACLTEATEINSMLYRVLSYNFLRATLMARAQEQMWILTRNLHNHFVECILIFPNLTAKMC